MSEQNEQERLERALETIDLGRRDAMRKMVIGTVFVVPIVASFSIDGLTVSPALAASNSS